MGEATARPLWITDCANDHWKNMLHLIISMALIGASSVAAQSTAPIPRTDQLVPFIVNGGQCEDECDEYMSRQLMGVFATSLQACKGGRRFFVYGNQVGQEDGATLMITSSRLQRSEDGSSMLMFLTGSISGSDDHSVSEEGATASLEYNMETNRLLASATFLPQKTAYLRCRVALPSRYGED